MEAASAKELKKEPEDDLEKEMNANQWTREEHYHFLKVRPTTHSGRRPSPASLPRALWTPTSLFD